MPLLFVAPGARPTAVTGGTVVAAVPIWGALVDVVCDPLLSDDPSAIASPDTVAAGVELLAAAVTSTAVVFALALLQVTT